MKVITDIIHGILDYVTVALFALAPSLFGFGGTAALISYALAVIHLTMTLLTVMPLGLIKIIPMKLHSIVEMLVGPVLIIGALALPGLVIGGQWFFVVAGAMIFVIWLLSDYGPRTKFDERSPK
ncbi:hypothetical protein [Mesorhizobium sp.]|jgi:hypothetical protein|uniref:hypothetical protein n=1 Tax=Mesorhizobium sp. TaxID=1871066 RepID=UPI00356799B2